MRVPFFSLVFFVVGVGIGALADDRNLAMLLGGTGSVLGYVLWTRARLRAIRAGKAFHIGSVINILICTIVAIGLGVAGIAGSLMPADIAKPIAQLSMLVVSVVVVRLHWSAAREARQAQGTPTEPLNASN